MFYGISSLAGTLLGLILSTTKHGVGSGYWFYGLESGVRIMGDGQNCCYKPLNSESSETFVRHHNNNLMGVRIDCRHAS